MQRISEINTDTDNIMLPTV